MLRRNTLAAYHPSKSRVLALRSVGLHCVEHAPGQQGTLIGVNKDISELLDHDSVKGLLEAVTSVHCQQAGSAV